MMSDSIAFGREVTGSQACSETKEWLVTNGIGGFASGTISGTLTRRYHGLLIAALNPPINRTLLATKIEEEASYDGSKYGLSTNRWISQEISPKGFKHIESFFLDGQIPTWRFAIGDALLEKKIWMEQGANTTYILYKLIRASSPLTLSLKVLVNYRSYHSLTRADGWKMEITPVEKGFKVLAFPSAVPFTVKSSVGIPRIDNIWYGNYFLNMERERGLDCTEDHLLAGTIDLSLIEGQEELIVISTEKEPVSKGAYLRRKEHETRLIKKDLPWFMRVLYLAADQFIVKNNIIAGYPWFTNWGRDTMVSLKGLTLITERASIAKSILETYAEHIDQGMLPNRCQEDGKLEYNTVDAALWYFKAVHDTFDATNDTAFLKKLYPKLQEIIDWYTKSTRYNIHVDPQDGLLYAGKVGLQLTWMDVKIGSQVITPRIGKPIEVNALWYNALKSMSYFSKVLNLPSLKFDTQADLCKKGFERFFNASCNFCFDVLDGPQGNDNTLRPNQLLIISLRESLLSSDKQRLVFESVEKKLFTTYGIRTLPQDDKNYHGSYCGDPFERDSSYHQGTAWGYLLGIYIQAHLRIYQDPDAATQILSPIRFHLMTAGLGSCSEIYDGDAPMHPRGCIAQAWSVGTLIEAYDCIEKMRKTS